MMVKELIAAMVEDEDMSSPIFVKIKRLNGDIEYFGIEGIALNSDSIRFSGGVCTTLVLDGCI